MTDSRKNTVKLAILDRDGVINADSDAHIKSAAEWQPIAGSLEAIVRLKHAGYTVFVASNQSGIGRGLFDYAALFSIHDKMNRMLAELGTRLDGIFFCPHAPEDGCDCRKPATGLLDSIARRLGRSLDDVPVIGDSKRDIEAARAVGAMPMLVATGKGAHAEPERIGDVARYPNLAAAVDAILQKTAINRL